MIQIQSHQRGNKLIALARRVVALQRVRLAQGETNNIELVTRSVTNCHMREHSLTTAELTIGRAFERTFGNTVLTHPFASQFSNGSQNRINSQL